MNLRRFLFGDPLKTSNLEGESLSKFKALAIFSSDVLSSVAYATEEILLSLGALLAFAYCLPIAFVIGALIVIVCISYWQTIREYPNGGGAFSVAHKNLGEKMGLLVSASLLVDYTLTVAVSLSAGAHAITSAFPILSPYTVPMCLTILFAIVITNLRGTRESAVLLAIPTYCFIACMFGVILYGIFFKDAVPMPENLAKADTSITFGVFCLLLKGFSSGCSALTGIEAIAGGVPAFDKPKARNAQITLVIMACILFSLFLGITYLSYKFKILPIGSESVVSQLAKNVCGTGFMYYVVQFMTAFILLLAANTSFAGFPRLASVLAKEKYIPTSFANLGDRLAFSNGIILLAVVATILIVSFNADTHLLIPLYSIGVFISFTLSQAGMVKHCIREKKDNWYFKAIISGFGALVTFVTLLIIIEGKFVQGAWIVFILLPTIMFMFKKVNTQYKKNYKALDPKNGGLGSFLEPSKDSNPKIIVPISRIHEGTLSALQFAETISNDVTAVIVNVNNKESDKLKLAWRAMKFEYPLVVLDSPYRSVLSPFFEFLNEMDKENGKPTMIVLPSFVPGKIWENILHNQTAAIMKTALMYRKHSFESTRIIVDVPFQLPK